MTKAESTLRTIELERKKSHKGYEVFLHEIDAIHKKNASDVCSFGIDMFLLGIAKGRRMEKAAQKQKKSAPPKILYNDRHEPVSLTDCINDIMSLLNQANFREVRLVWIAANRLIDRKEVSTDGKVH